MYDTFAEEFLAHATRLNGPAMMGGMVDTGRADGPVQRRGEETPPAVVPQRVADLWQVV
jgi:hypothetical protein